MLAITAEAPCPTKDTVDMAGAVRRNERRAFHANVRVLPLDGRLPASGGIVTDLSRDGLFVSSVRPLPTDALVLLQIYSPRHHSRIRLLGRVVHRRPDEGFGCRFVDLDHVQRIVLDRFLRNTGANASTPMDRGEAHPSRTARRAPGALPVPNPSQCGERDRAD